MCVFVCICVTNVYSVSFLLSVFYNFKNNIDSTSLFCVYIESRRTHAHAQALLYVYSHSYEVEAFARMSQHIFAIIIQANSNIKSTKEQNIL